MVEGDVGKAKKQRQRCWTIKDRKEGTHQETATLPFPLETTQFFSSGLIIVG